VGDEFEIITKENGCDLFKGSIEHLCGETEESHSHNNWHLGQELNCRPPKYDLA
jgi:hypothetical protein